MEEFANCKNGKIMLETAVERNERTTCVDLSNVGWRKLSGSVSLGVGARWVRLYERIDGR